MEFDLNKLISDINFRIDDSGDLQAMVDGVWQPTLDLLLAEQDRWVDQGDVDQADSNTVNAMLADLGNPFDIALTLTLNQRRQLVRLLVPIYLAKGTEPSLRDVIRALTGIEIVGIVFPTAPTGWILGRDVLGDAPPVTVADPELTDIAILGSNPSAILYSFKIEVPIVLTSEQEAIITEIVGLTKPAHTHFLGFVDPTPAPTIDHWEVGLSAIHKTGEALQGDEVDLHE